MANSCIIAIKHYEMSCYWNIINFGVETETRLCAGPCHIVDYLPVTTCHEVVVLYIVQMLVNRKEPQKHIDKMEIKEISKYAGMAYNRSVSLW